MRWYCAESHTTFSQLPDCFAAGLPGTLCELERAVLIGEREADPARAACQAHPNPGVKPKAARRWLRRRQEMVSRSLMTIVMLLPDLFAGCPPTVGALRAHLATDALLMTLRDPCANQLKSLRPAVGFFPHNFAPNRKPTLQHKLGRDPPRLWRSGFLLPGESGGRQGAAPRRRPRKTIYSCRPPGRFGSHRPAANRRRADAAPAPLSVLPGGHLPASIRRTSVNLCAKDNQRLVPEHAARTSSRCLRTGAESGEREDRQPSPSSFPRSRDSHRPPGDWTASIAQGLRDLGRSRAVFPDFGIGLVLPKSGRRAAPAEIHVKPVTRAQAERNSTRRVFRKN